MGRKAKPLQSQVDLLRSRGMIIDDPEKARIFLLEIGFYRLSFYWFPFETRYPDRLSANHQFKPGANFRDALMLYAFDFNLRNMLLKYLERIETAFRNYMIYSVSTHYPNSPCWFADRHVVGDVQSSNFERSVYAPMRRNNPEILLHHRRFPRDKFAPAWKTMEFMTFGSVCNLYNSLTNHNIKHDIAQHFGVNSESFFEYYMDVIKDLRNLCAHGNILYSFRPGAFHAAPECPRRHKGGGGNMPHPDSLPRNLNGALKVVAYFLESISARLHKEFESEIRSLLSQFTETPGTTKVLHDISGFRIPASRGSAPAKGYSFR